MRTRGHESRNGNIFKVFRLLGISLLITAGFAMSAAAQWTVTAQTYPITETNIEAELISLTVSNPEQPAMAASITQTLDGKIGGVLYDHLNTVREYAAGGNVQYGPYSVNASLVDYRVAGNLLSVLVYDDLYAGGPHPWGVYTSANFDLTTGALLQISDIIGALEGRTLLLGVMNGAWQSSEYASAYTQAELLEFAKLCVSGIDDAAWTFCDSGLRLNYAGGEVMAYAVGPSQIILPGYQLNGILRADYLQTTLAGGWTVSGTEATLAAPPVTNHSYQFIQTDMTWWQASNDAQQRGGHLAVITSAEEQQQIEALLAQYPHVHTVWIGGMKSGNTFVWTTGEPFAWTKWGPGEPNNETNDENFMDMYEKDGVWVWNDVPNDIAKYYSGHMGYLLEIE